MGSTPPPPRPRPCVQASADSKFDDYKPRVAFFFPGQGAQTVGMCKEVAAEVPAAKELFDRASEILGYDLLQVCAEGEGAGALPWQRGATCHLPPNAGLSLLG